MLISDRIAALILSLLQENGGMLEIGRNDMASRIGCSPSQINYVIASRFSPEHGFTVESRRGGGGYIRIVQNRYTEGNAHLMHAFASIGEAISPNGALAVISALRDAGSISAESYTVLRAAVSSPMPQDGGDILRAELFRRMLFALANL